MSKHQVTERDFRRDEFKDAKVEDYEFDGEGCVVRKDRWQSAITEIRFMLGIDGRTFEIADVVKAVGELVDGHHWQCFEDDGPPSEDVAADLLFADGSIFNKAFYTKQTNLWTWGGVWTNQNEHLQPIAWSCK